MTEDDSGSTEPPSGPSRWPIVAAVATGVLGAALLVFGAMGFLAASSADDEAQEFATATEALETQLDDLVAQRTALDDRVTSLNEAEAAVAASIEAQIDAGNDAVDAGNAIITIYQDAVDKGNAGDLAGERAQFENEGGAALLEAAAAVDAHREANADFPDLISALGELLR